LTVATTVEEAPHDEEVEAPVSIQEEETPVDEEEQATVHAIVPVQIEVAVPVVEELPVTVQEPDALEGNLTSQDVESFMQEEDEHAATTDQVQIAMQVVKADKLQETVEGLSVSVKELWSCVTDLVAKADESAALEKGKEESECTTVTADYVQKYARQYAKQYTRQYVQAYRALLQEEVAKNTEERKASVEACNLENETTVADVLPAEHCDADGVLLQLPAFKTELTAFKTPA